MKDPTPPPLVFMAVAAGMLGGAVLLGPSRSSLAEIVGGVALIVLGGVLHQSAARAFLRRGTTLATLAEPTTLVTSGVFAWTRNPMYLAGLPILAGWALALSHPATWLGPLLWPALAEILWIRPEERLLSRTLGPEWEAYRARVRRWI